MRYATWCAGLIGLALFLTLGVAPAQAQATRTWVSGVGDDANPCSRTAPCKTFAGAISKTAAGGEINVLDPGGFGAVTVTKSITISSESFEAGVLVSGANGVIVNAAGATVILRGLDFQGLGTGTNGVNILAASSVKIENCVIRGFSTAGINVGISSGGVALDVTDTIISNNSGTGIFIKPTGSANVRGSLDRVRVLNSGGDGVFVNANTTTGSIKVAVRDSNSANNTGNGFGTFSGGSVAQIQIESSVASNNGTGLAATGSNAVIRFTRSTVTANGTAATQGSGGSVLSYITNSVDGNGNDGTFGTTSQR
jgi:Right handed beta helix region